MLKIVYDRKCTKVSMAGHADSAEYGHDLVCAAASILAYTLAENAAQMVEDGQAVDAILQLEPGNTIVQLDPVSEFFHVATMIFDSIVCGFRLLAEQYPDHVTFTQV